MNHLHPFTAATCLATAVLLGGISLYAEPRAIEVPVQSVEPVAQSVEPTPQRSPLPASTLPATDATDDVAAEVVPRLTPECPEYVEAIANSHARRTLVVLTFNGCQACESLVKDLKKHSVPFAEINREKHPRSFSTFRPSLCPTWYAFRNGKTVASGAGSHPAAFFQQILAEQDTP